MYRVRWEVVGKTFLSLLRMGVFCGGRRPLDGGQNSRFVGFFFDRQ
jgi:hypothetical protein